MSVQSTSTIETRLIAQVLRPFGCQVQFIGKLLILYGPQTVHFLAGISGYSIKRVKEVLLILFRHHLVRTCLSSTQASVLQVKPSGTVYELVFRNCLNRLFFPSWLVMLKNGEVHIPKKINDDAVHLDGRIMADIMSLVFFHANIKGSSVVKNLCHKYSTTLLEGHLALLFRYKFVDYFANPASSLMITSESRKEATLSSSSATPINPLKRQKVEPFDCNRLLTFCSERFFEEMQVSMISKFFNSTINSTAAMLFEFIYDCFVENSYFGDPYQEPSSPKCVSFVQISQRWPHNVPLNVEYSISTNVPILHDSFAANMSQGTLLREYLFLMIQKSHGILRLSDDRSPSLTAGSFSIVLNFQAANEFLGRTILESFVREKYGLRTARIWKCLERKQLVEEKHLAKSCLLDLKAVRERVLVLFSQGLIDMQVVAFSHCYVSYITL